LSAVKAKYEPAFANLDVAIRMMIALRELNFYQTWKLPKMNL
jgi:hypothetical protein